MLIVCAFVLATQLPAAPADTASLCMAMQSNTVFALPAARVERGIPVMQALKLRASAREYSDTALPLPVFADLLWAASGVNRADSGKRTAPSAMNWQEVDVYACTADGVYRYLPKEHAIELVSSNDIRAATGTQPFVKDAAVNLVFVGNLDKVRGSDPARKEAAANVDAAFISENVYLFCASEGLATVVRGSVDRAALGKLLGLGPEQRVLLAQTVGYPK